MQAKRDLFNRETAGTADLFKTLSHPARLAILEVLASRGTCICGDIVDELPLAQATVSQHLSVLKGAGLIKGSIDGPRSCYCIDFDALNQMRSQLGGFLESLPTAPQSPQCC